MKKCVKTIIYTTLTAGTAIGMYYAGKFTGYNKGYDNGRKDEESMNKCKACYSKSNYCNNIAMEYEGNAIDPFNKDGEESVQT